MNPHLPPDELALVRDVFQRHPEVTAAIIFGSRAMGTHTVRSDVDLVVSGDVTPLAAEGIAAELDELPLPYRFEVQSLDHIRSPSIREHISRAGLQIHPAPE